MDTIQEIKKGARGADCLQTISIKTKSNCGSILYESKRTNTFQPKWIEKFKMDIQEKGATIGVLVSEVLPKGVTKITQINGIWVCTMEDFKALSIVLRDSLIQLDQALSSQNNKGDKMSLLYQYLTGNQFKMSIEAIVEGLSQMQEDLTKEKRAIEGHWKKREHQLRKVMLNTSNLYSSFRGIAGQTIPEIKALEMLEPEANGQTMMGG